MQHSNSKLFLIPTPQKHFSFPLQGDVFGVYPGGLDPVRSGKLNEEKEWQHKSIMLSLTDNICWVPQQLAVQDLYTATTAKTNEACRIACRKADGCPFYQHSGSTCKFVTRNILGGPKQNVFAKVTNCLSSFRFFPGMAVFQS